MIEDGSHIPDSCDLFPAGSRVWISQPGPQERYTWNDQAAPLPDLRVDDEVEMLHLMRGIYSTSRWRQYTRKGWAEGKVSVYSRAAGVFDSGAKHVNVM